MKREKRQIVLKGETTEEIVSTIQDKYSREEWCTGGLSYGILEYDEVRQIFFDKYNKKNGLIEDMGRPNNALKHEEMIRYYFKKLGYRVVGDIKWHGGTNESLKNTIENILIDKNPWFSGQISWDSVIEVELETIEVDKKTVNTKHKSLPYLNSIGISMSNPIEGMSGIMNVWDSLHKWQQHIIINELVENALETGSLMTD